MDPCLLFLLPHTNAFPWSLVHLLLGYTFSFSYNSFNWTHIRINILNLPKSSCGLHSRRQQKCALLFSPAQLIYFAAKKCRANIQKNTGAQKIFRSGHPATIYDLRAFLILTLRHHSHIRIQNVEFPQVSKNLGFVPFDDLGA